MYQVCQDLQTIMLSTACVISVSICFQRLSASVGLPLHFIMSAVLAHSLTLLNEVTHNSPGAKITLFLDVCVFVWPFTEYLTQLVNI